MRREVGRDEEERQQNSEVGGQKTDERGQKIGLNGFNDFNGLNEFAGGERLNDLNDLNNGPLTTDYSLGHCPTVATA
ncbi:MAG: hypothetical protein LJE89_07340 [Deltaproteobacteria bacterium]|nr:hypothetical protein [Deltaproteobacteria bacterium]